MERSRALKRRVRKTRYFHGDAELVDVCWRLVGEIEAGTDLRAQDEARRNLGGPRQLAGRLPRPAPGEAWTDDHLRFLPVERTVQYLATPNPHVCDWRCEGGAPGGECRCQCEGRNHGRKYVCAEV